MSIEINSSVLAKELNQGIVPLGIPAAYKYDAALVEAAKAAVNQGIKDISTMTDEHEETLDAYTAAKKTDLDAFTLTKKGELIASAEAAAKIVAVGVDIANAPAIQSAIILACDICGVPAHDLLSRMNYYLWEHNIPLNNVMHDNLHPNDQGYEIMYNIFKKVLCL